jgi:sialate O-acetylesterase
MRLLLVALIGACSLPAAVRLPSIFSDHMVLQRGMKAPVWGWADAGEAVTVSLGKQTVKAVAGADGKWMVRLSAEAGKAAQQMVVKGSNTITIADVLVGEVWLCSGQSNMAMKVSAARDFEQEKAAADYPQIRMFLVANRPAKTAQTEVEGKWVVASPETIGQFSATGYFFAREVYKTLGTPVAILNSSVGGTAIELWIREEAQRGSAALRPAIAAVEKQIASFDRAAVLAKHEVAMKAWKQKGGGGRAPVDPVGAFERRTSLGTLYNGMIAPLVGYGIRGGLWYQGEANSTPEKAPFYEQHLRLLVNDWRAQWGQGTFPFAWVQLPNFTGEGRDWPLVREGMLKALGVPQTGMAITIDIGEAGDIHPKNKQDVGKRLSMWALGAVYGRKVAISGPLAGKPVLEKGSLIVPFTHADGGLKAKDGDLRGFEIAGADGKWTAARAWIAGKTVVVSSEEVGAPVAVRYGWANDPSCNLYNGAGLPASPFRSE